MKNNPVSMTLLFDYYGELLTEKQRAYFDLYYNQDFSLAEIAEEEGVSRQGVYDTLRRTETILRRFEDKTGIIARAQERAAQVERIRAAARTVLELPGGRPVGEEILAACEGIKE